MATVPNFVFKVLEKVTNFLIRNKIHAIFKNFVTQVLMYRKTNTNFLFYEIKFNRAKSFLVYERLLFLCNCFIETKALSCNDNED